MRIVLGTCGSRGDVQPVIALALALIRAGHDCLLLGPPERKRWAESMGCPYVGFGPDITAFIDTLNNPLSVNSVKGFHRLVQDALEDQLRRLPAFVRNADRIIASSLFFGAASVAGTFGIPYRYILFTPQVMPSAAHPFPVIRTQTLPRAINRLSWRLSVLGDIPYTRLKLNRFASQKGLPRVWDAWKTIIGNRPILACDPQIAQIPEDVEMQVTQTGYFHLDRMERMAPEIETFLSERQRAVFSGFGSMPGRDQKRHVGTMIRVARQNGVGIIISAPWISRVAERIDRDALLVKFCPHRRVFPRMKAVIHHGGAGTTATTALSGVPQVIVPHILDQYYHGHQIFRRGLGPRPVWRNSLSEEKLARAVDEAINDASMARKAKQAGEDIHPKQSFERAVRTIESDVPVSAV